MACLLKARDAVGTGTPRFVPDSSNTPAIEDTGLIPSLVCRRRQIQQAIDRNSFPLHAHVLVACDPRDPLSDKVELSLWCSADQTSEPAACPNKLVGHMSGLVVTG